MESLFDPVIIGGIIFAAGLFTSALVNGTPIRANVRPITED